MNYSPLRYPGGKAKITPLVNLLMESSGVKNGTYIEPFVGGAGVALTLLFNNKVDRIVINAINSERDFRKTQQKISNNIENSLQMIA